MSYSAETATAMALTADRGDSSARDVTMAREAGHAIAGFVNGDAPFTVTLERATGERLETKIPGLALSLLAEALEDMSRGKTVKLVRHPEELTTHQAAGFLHVSRPFLIKLLDQRAIAHRKVGRHRRVRYDDLEVYLEKEKAARRETLAELAAHDQEIGLGDVGPE